MLATPEKRKHLRIAAMTTVGGLIYVAFTLWIQFDLNWARAYDQLQYLLGKTAALTCFTLVMMWAALLINHVSTEDWFAISDQKAIAIVWASLLVSMAFAWAWG